MAKQPKKPQGITNAPQNSPNQTLKLVSKNQDEKEHKPTLKSKQRIDKDYYQKNKEKRKQQRRERYQQQKLQAQQIENEQLSKYYGAEAIKVLMSFKEYIELNQAKKKLWLDFNWTAKDYQKSIEKGYADIVMIMKLEETAHKLVRDYWDTAKSEEKQKGKSWNNLDYDEQQRLIRYWGYEKTRIENNYLTEEERLEKQSKECLKEIELAKFHEERGKKDCLCYQCEQKKKIQKEVKAKLKKDQAEAEKAFDNYWGASDKEKCPGCGKLKVLDEEVGVCKKCKEIYE